MTRARSDDSRQLIREAASRCFVQRGYAATRLIDIAREAGLSKGGLYFHYRAKEDLFREILARHVATIEERWGFEPATDQPADRLVDRLVVAHLQTMQDEPGEVRLLNQLIALASGEPALRQRLEEVVGVLATLYRTMIARGIAQGVFKGEPEVLTMSVLAFVHGVGGLTVMRDGHALVVSPEEGGRLVVAMLRG